MTKKPGWAAILRGQAIRLRVILSCGEAFRVSLTSLSASQLMLKLWVIINHAVSNALVPAVAVPLLQPPPALLR